MMLYYLSSMMMLNFSMINLMLSMLFLMFKNSYLLEWNLFIMNSVNMNMLILLDWITFMFLFTVLLISSMIMMYCSEYMNHDKYNIRFYYLVLLFIMSMIFMIISPNMVSILLGWDGLGLISYCLVIYYQNFSSYNSGMLTILLNRIGDVMILLTISLMFINGSWNYINLNSLNYLVILFITITSFTKSAQFPFSSWLPAAMAAPTPVSSLVHSSTLVTAGVYLMIRFNYLIFKNNNLMMFIYMTGMITMLMAGMSACFEFDMKKIIAYSTLSQLGLMFVIFSMKNSDLTFFHLIIHAMFKSMMFMCSGVLIHSLLDYQDIRSMSMMKYKYPMTFSMFIISNLSLCGMPFMSGFYSKDQILEYNFMNLNNLMLYYLLMLSTGMTMTYSIRLIYYLMKKNMNFLCLSQINDFKLMNKPMYLLMFMSMFLGNLLNWILFNNIELIFLQWEEKISILLICLMFYFLGKLNMNTKMKLMKLYFFKMFMGKMWFLNNFIPMIISNPFMMIKIYNHIFDKGWSEMFFKNSFIMLFKKFNYINFKINKINLTIIMTNILFILMMMMMI